MANNTIILDQVSFVDDNLICSVGGDSGIQG
jgi:hypothetical protein